MQTKRMCTDLFGIHSYRVCVPTCLVFTVPAYGALIEAAPRRCRPKGCVPTCLVFTVTAYEALIEAAPRRCRPKGCGGLVFAYNAGIAKDFSTARQIRNPPRAGAPQLIQPATCVNTHTHTQFTLTLQSTGHAVGNVRSFAQNLVLFN